MFDHYPDVNHDGKHDVEDAIIFHSEMDAVNEADREHRRSSVSGSTIHSGPVGSPDWAAEVILKAIFLGIPVGYFALLVSGILPINVVTAFLALFLGTGFVRMLTLL